MLLLRSLVISLLLGIAPAFAEELRFANIFGDGVVLQRDKPIKIWGWAKPDASVSVTFADQQQQAMADASGRWIVTLAPVPASFEPQEMKVQSDELSRVVKDILIGDVWICGGQSNMEWNLSASRDADVEIPAADFQEIRFIRLPKIARAEPLSDFPVDNPKAPVGNWRRATRDQVANCTGVGYYFARRIFRHQKVPVGLVDTSWGGTMAQHWVSPATLRSIPEMKPYFDDFESKVQAWRDGGEEAGAEKRYAEEVAKWEEAREQAKQNGQREPRRPNRDQYTNPSHKRQPGGMLNGCIMPIRDLAIKGVLFYQGENNSFGESWKPFYKSYPAVISDWRSVFKEPELPFGLVQIAGWSTRRSMQYDMNHHCNVVREIQLNTWKQTPHCGLIPTYDTNSSESIHPSRKAPVGERLARWALAEVYGQTDQNGNPLEWKGPVYVGTEQRDGKLYVTFEEGTSRGLVLDQYEDAGFYIAGKDRVFHHARARTDSRQGQLIVWSDEVPEPVAVRYGWSNIPAGGLMNRRELPAYPFRTDDWPMTPHQSTGSYVPGKPPLP